MSFGRQPFVTGGTSWSVKNDTKYERIRKVNVPEWSSQSMSIMTKLLHHYFSAVKISTLKGNTDVYCSKKGVPRKII